jgi:glycosyltransferase involved in cell wall biosynthesis
MSKVSVVIVTKDRQEDLKHCLGSLAAQSIILDELIVVDNNSSDLTQRVVRYFSHSVKFKVKYVCEKKVGYPIVYNRGLLESAYDWVAFIDDDCVADFNWFSNIKKVVSKSPSVMAILGQSDTYFSNNIYSLSTNFFDYLWKEDGSDKWRIKNYETLDNKNIVYHKKTLFRKNIKFDESRIDRHGGASEDCDLGRQIKENNGKAIYVRQIKVSHKDPQDFKWYFKKYVSSLKGYLSYQEKWNLEFEQTIQGSQSQKVVKSFIYKNKLGISQQLQFIILVYFTMVIDYFFLLIFKTQLSKKMITRLLKI